MLDNFSNLITVITGIIGILSLFAAIIANWIRTGKTTADNKKSLADVTGTIQILANDVQETKFDTKEGNRLLTALHGRLDRVEQVNSKLRVNQIRLDERVKFLHSEFKSLKDTQKIRPVE